VHLGHMPWALTKRRSLLLLLLPLVSLLLILLTLLLSLVLLLLLLLLPLTEAFGCISPVKSEDLEVKQIVIIVRVKVHFEVEIFSENVVITRCQNHDHIFVNLNMSNFWQKNI
jgi:hypothetical protein